MKKYRVNTTISQKHHELLKKQALKLGTQQIVLEQALESLDKSIDPESSPEEELWMQLFEVRNLTAVLPRDLTRILFETIDEERTREWVENVKHAEMIMEWFYNKPLKECTLQEIINLVVLSNKVQGSCDTINYTDEEDHYRINITHSLGIGASKLHLILFGSLFKTYGAPFETDYSERTVYFKVFKN